jgi:hypothetical protein
MRGRFWLASCLRRWDIRPSSRKDSSELRKDSSELRKDSSELRKDSSELKERQQKIYGEA